MFSGGNLNDVGKIGKKVVERNNISVVSLYYSDKLNNVESNIIKLLDNGNLVNVVEEGVVKCNDNIVEIL